MHNSALLWYGVAWRELRPAHDNGTNDRKPKKNHHRKHKTDNDCDECPIKPSANHVNPPQPPFDIITLRPATHHEGQHDSDSDHCNDWKDNAHDYEHCEPPKFSHCDLLDSLSIVRQGCCSDFRRGVSTFQSIDIEVFA